MDTIKHYASFPATGVSLRQMVQFGERPSTGMIVLRSHTIGPRWTRNADRAGRNALSGVTIPVGGASDSPGAPGPRAGSLTGWLE